MAIEILEIFVEYNKNMSKELKDIYVYYNKKPYSLQELRVGKSDTTLLKLKDYDDFEKALQNGELIFPNENGEYFTANKIDKKAKCYVKNIRVPSVIISDRYPKDVDNLPLGLNRKLTIESTDDFTSGELLYCQVGDKFEYVAKSDILYYTPEGQEKKLFDEIFKSVKEIKDKGFELYTVDERPISGILDGKSFKVKEIESQEEVDLTNLTFTSINGEETRIEPYFSTQKHVKVNGQSKREIKNFTFNKQGKYIKVRIQGQNVDTMVSIDDLGITDINSAVGQSFKIKTKDGEPELYTQPLTYMQSQVRYDSVYTMQEKPAVEKSSDEDKKSLEEVQKSLDEEYIKLKNGKFVKKSIILKPVGYDIVKSPVKSPNDYDALLITYKDGDEQKTEIFSKEMIGKKLNDLGLNISAVQHIKKSTRSITECDVVQTSYGNSDRNSCIVTNENKQLSKAEYQEIIKQLTEQYKNGTYTVDEVLVNGNYEKLDEKGKTYIYSDTILTDDLLADADKYKYLKDKPLTWKDGELTGGPTFNFGKSFSKDSATFREYAIKAALLPFTLGGFLVMAGFPWIFPTLVATGVGFTGFYLIKNIIKGVKVKNKNKVKGNAHQHSKDLTVELINEKFRELANQTKHSKNIDQNSFLNEFNNIQNLILCLGESKFEGQFGFKDNKATVDETNLPLYQNYLEEIAELDKEIAMTKKMLKKDPSLASKLAELEDKKKDCVESYQSNGAQYSKDSKFDYFMKKSEIFKSIYDIKYFTKDKIDLSDEEKKFIDNIDYDFASDIYRYKGKAISYLFIKSKLEGILDKAIESKIEIGIEKDENKDLEILTQKEETIKAAEAEAIKAAEAEAQAKAQKEEQEKQAEQEERRKKWEELASKASQVVNAPAPSKSKENGKLDPYIIAEQKICDTLSDLNSDQAQEMIDHIKKDILEDNNSKDITLTKTDFKKLIIKIEEQHKLGKSAYKSTRGKNKEILRFAFKYLQTVAEYSAVLQDFENNELT